MPLYEAIMNSIHAINDRKVTTGKIDVRVIRNTPQQRLTNEVVPVEPVTGFEITDNGIGFDHANFESFCTSDSPLKRKIGGKGVGRLTWLKAFQFAEIESRFRDNGSTKLRRFAFKPTDNGIESHSIDDVDAATPETTVRLRSYRKDFVCPKRTDTICFNIIEHFLQFFTLDTCPIITVHDECEVSPIVLNDLYNTDVKLEDETTTFKVNDHSMTIRHVRLSSKIAKSHSLQFCVDSRPVSSEDASKYVPNLQGLLMAPNDADSFVYAGYISGKLLTERADQTRSSFDIPRQDTLLAGEKETTWEDIIGTASKQCAKFLRPYTEPIRTAKHARISEYVKLHPKYRPLLKHKPEWIDEVPVGVRDDDIDVWLYRLNQRYDAELRDKGRKLDAKKVSTAKLESHIAKLANYLKEWNEAGHAKLCEYVVHRRSILEFLGDCLKRQEDGDFALEDIIHDTIISMRVTSDDEDATNTNLWVIDERLCYHYFLASDKQLRSVSPVKVKREAKQKRSDVLVFHEAERFDNPVAIIDSDSQPFDSITVIEFKRPNRDDYTAEDNPIDQVEEYVEHLRSGKGVDKTGQLIPVRPNTQFYAYIACTITEKVRNLAKRRGFTEMPDGQGFFKMHPNFGLYEEIVDYRKILKDAHRRNQSFFDKLNIPQKA
jgi:hypothetical protein